MKQHKDILIGSIVVIVLILASVFIGLNSEKDSTDATAATSGPSALAAVESSFDFGTVSMAKGDVVHEFTITNTASSSVMVTKLYTSCMCTKAVLKAGGKEIGPFGMPGHGLLPSVNATITPGERASITAIFDPAAHGPAGVGRIDRAIYVENTSGQPLELRFSAQVTP